MRRSGLQIFRQLQSSSNETLQMSPGCLNSLRSFASGSHGDLGTVSGAPVEAYQRKVTIYSPARTASQQGLSKTLDKASKRPNWKMEFSTQEKWENPLIGWTSTADPLEHVARAALEFETSEDAVRFCQQHGWDYEVQEPHLRRTSRAKRFLGYGDNFSTKQGGLPDGGLISEGTAEPIKRTKGRTDAKISQ